MIPCFICKKDIGGGWWHGFPPAPDSQKMGLCAGHDSPAAREEVKKAWQLQQNALLGTRLEIEQKKHAPKDTAFLLEIQFRDGGLITMRCAGQDVLKDSDILVITLENDERRFYPLRQIRSYTIHSLSASPASSAGSLPLP